MRCLVCERWSFPLLCRTCQEKLLRPQMVQRQLLPGWQVVSFYPYAEIERFLLTKQTPIGSALFRILAANSFEEFARNFTSFAYVVPIDDHIDAGYSHTAILAQACKSAFLRPVFGVLRARNRVEYGGKSLDFRLKNPRDFHYSGPKGDIILIDDIITTGTTLKEAYAVCKRAGANPLFALTLARVE